MPSHLPSVTVTVTVYYSRAAGERASSTSYEFDQRDFLLTNISLIPPKNYNMMVRHEETVQSRWVLTFSTCMRAPMYIVLQACPRLLLYRRQEEIRALKHGRTQAQLLLLLTHNCFLLTLFTSFPIFFFPVLGALLVGIDLWVYDD